MHQNLTLLMIINEAISQLIIHSSFVLLVIYCGSLEYVAFWPLNKQFIFQIKTEESVYKLDLKKVQFHIELEKLGQIWCAFNTRGKMAEHLISTSPDTTFTL